ncbi:MAG: hypothetical protein V1874_15855 [Spirochaetota bacterium]
MKITHLVNKFIRQRILFVIAGMSLLSFILLLLFYSLFLILPSLFINAGLISPIPLLVIFILSMVIPFVLYSYQKPFFGKSFLKDIILSPYNSGDVKSAMELERGSSFPSIKENIQIDDKNISAELTEQFNEKIIKHLKPENKLFSGIMPGIYRKAFCIIIVLISSALSFFKNELVSDVYFALRTGLPVELIALDSPIKFRSLEAGIIPPAYIESGVSETVDLNIRNKIKVIQGSVIFVKGNVMNIESGRLILSAGKGVEYFTVTVSEGNRFEVSFLAPMKGAFALEIAFSQPVEGKLFGKSKVFMIEALPDRSPSIKIYSPPVHHNVLFGNPVEINYSASDDYGILEIFLYHRNPEAGPEYFKEIVARFPKEAKTNYSAGYVWNPVLREGEKIDELVYDQGTESVEYYLEVRDINVFSSGGTARSESRYLHFTDAFSEIKNAINIIEELITKGKKLLKSPENKSTIAEYKGKLSKAVDLFSKDLNEVLPQSSLLQKTNDMLNSLYIDNSQKLKESLKSYIAFLERYLIFINLMIETERAGSIDKEQSRIDDAGADLKASLNRINRQSADLLEKEFKRELQEIEDLIKKGDRAGAQKKIIELLAKMKKKMSENLAKSTAMSKKIAAEVKEKLEKISRKARKVLQAQEANKINTEKGRLKAAYIKQKEINERLSALGSETQKLSSEYPFIMYTLNSHAGSARLFSEKAIETLEKNQQNKSSQNQARVIEYLKGLLEASTQQGKLMDELAAGNFESVMQRGFANRFVLIPKEAIYTIPIDYKNKIIELSKDRSKSTKEKEAFWKDILE